MDEEEEQVNSLLPIVYSRSRYYERLWGKTRGEYVSAAFLGALKAIRRYRPDKGASLATYARQRIDGEIIDWHRTERQQRGGSRKEKNRHVAFCVDFNDLGNREHGAKTLASIIEVEYGEVNERGFDYVESDDTLAHLKARMEERDWDILYRCVCKEETYRSVGESHGISESRVCQILPGILRKARKIIEGRSDEA